MKRFYYEKQHINLKFAGSIALFLAIFCAFFLGISNVSDETASNQTESLNRAIHRSIAHCYASEGHYPESLDYLKEHYGISYDLEIYFVDYQIFGENLFPDVTIILLEH